MEGRITLGCARTILRRYGPLSVLPMLYVAIAWGHWGIRRSELYPFAPWSMFNDVPNEVTRFVIHVRIVDDLGAARTVPIWECFPEGVKALPLPVYRAQTTLGLAIENRQLESAATARRTLSDFLKTHLGSGDAVLVREVFDPAEMYRDRTMSERRELLHLKF